MNRGLKIYTRILESADRMAAIRDLGNRDMQSLVRYIFRQELESSDTGGLICGMAHVAVMERFMTKTTEEETTAEEKTEDRRLEQEARDCAGAMGEGFLP